MAKLILVRHGKSVWNATGQWTGWTDVELNEDGIAEAKRAGEVIKDIPVDVAYTSDLKRAQQTHDLIVASFDKKLDAIVAPELKERSYGIYTGKNKWQVKEQVGDEEFQKIRRSWDHAVPEGESLKQVYARAVPYYEKHILPNLMAGKNVLVSAHGNSLRALVKLLEHIPDDKISELEFGTGEVWIYDVDSKGKIKGKEVRAANSNKLKI